MIVTFTFESVRLLTAGTVDAPVGVFETVTALENLLSVVFAIVTSNDAVYIWFTANFPPVRTGSQVIDPLVNADALSPVKVIVGADSPAAGAFETLTPKVEMRTGLVDGYS